MCLAIPGKVLSIHGEDVFRVGQISFGCIEKSVSLALVDEVGVGDYVIVHAGVAIRKLNEEAAQMTLNVILKAPEAI